MNKTTDKRFIDKRVSINKTFLRNIFLNAKENKRLTWKQLGDKLGVCEQTISHDWLVKGNTIPLSCFKKVLEMSDKYNIKKVENKLIIKEPFWGQKIKDGKIKTKNVRLPDKNTKEFAEFYGILLGDGCIFSNLYGVSISADKILDKPYLRSHIRTLVKNLFDVYPAYYESKKFRSINCIIHSKRIAEFLISLGFPKGKKAEGNLEIPKFIFNNRKLLASCIKGIMDTDGSLSSHPNSKIMIHLSITQPVLRKNVLNGLDKFGIKGGEFNKGIMLYGKDKIGKFNDQIGFSNKKNIIKYNKFLKTGVVPSSKEVETFIRDNSSF